MRAGIIWCALGGLGVVTGVVGAVVLFLGLGRHPFFYLVLLGWFGVSASAATSGWRSIAKANRALNDPKGTGYTAEDLDEPMDP